MFSRTMYDCYINLSMRASCPLMSDPEVVRQSQRKRFADEGLVDRVIELDSKWRKCESDLFTGDALMYGWFSLVNLKPHLPVVQYQAETLSKEFNSINKYIAALRKVTFFEIYQCILISQQLWTRPSCPL